jgi:bifunctional non-homologous end joining protein LigD
VFHGFHSQPVQQRRDAFDHHDWLFELKYDGFRALAHVRDGLCQLVSRNQHSFTSFSNLSAEIVRVLSIESAVLDGEIVCVDDHGRSQFRDLLWRRAEPCFFAFDLLYSNGQDLRTHALVDRKQELRRLLATVPKTAPICYADHVEGLGTALFGRACELDLEGIVAKRKFAPHESEREKSSWFKIRNPHYSQWAGREELFERERHEEPTPGWHTCDLACAGVEE